MQKSEGQYVKRELRGVWVATVKNIDWPSAPGSSTTMQKNELIRILDEHRKNNINTIFFQVRPSADAFYESNLEPWSMFITGKQGKAPAPFYDPLAFAIEEAHKRGMELHAWFNPYRATNDLDESHIAANHITRQKPEWFFTYANKKYFNPGLPDVRAYIQQVILSVVRDYDIDGVHFDDYFYPYPEKEALPDSATFVRYKGSFSNIDDWRRNNVDVLIKDLGDSIKNIKNYVKYGVSPSAIYRNSTDPSIGSATSGFEHYSQLFADSKKWIEKGWVDYLLPQIYFSFHYQPAAYETLLDWWAENSFGRHIYVGHGPYKLASNKNGWELLTQMPDQIRYLRANKNIQGSVYFSSKSVTTNMAHFQDSLRNDLYRYPALHPEMAWLDGSKPEKPVNLVVEQKDNGLQLSWQAPGPATYGYIIYKCLSTENLDVNNPAHIAAMIYDKDDLLYQDFEISSGKEYHYVVTAIDRLKNESDQSNLVKAIFTN